MKKDDFGCVKNTIRVRSGKYIDLVNPRADQFDFSDVAGALSKICRFSGQSNEFYSVSEHSCHCAFQALEDGQPREVCAAVFAHDFTEFALNDCVKPLKSLLPTYRKLEARMEAVIAYKFGINFHAYEPIIKEIDHAMLIAERRVLMTPDATEWQGENQVRTIKPGIRCWSPAEAEVIFSSYARMLGIVDKELNPIEGQQ